jgi:hypothetical protein
MNAPSPGIARVVVRDLQNGEHARRNAERREFVVHRPDLLRPRNLLDQRRFLHDLDVPIYKFLVRQAKKEHAVRQLLDALFLVLGMVTRTQFAPQIVECDLNGRMFTDPAVPMRAVARTLGARVRLDSLLFVRLAFLPAFGSLEHLARCRNDLLIRRQFYVKLISIKQIVFVCGSESAN